MSSFTKCVGVLILVAAAGWAIAEAQEQPGKKQAKFVSPEKAGYKDVIPGVTRATAWGDPDTGPHGAFTKFAPGFDAGTHSHTSDLRIVVIKGAYLYRTDGKETRVGSGEFLFVPGGTKHWSGGDPKEGALFYQEGVGKFDLNPEK
jgi:quercetin dioxygenase-like cupin family protein